MVRDTFAAYLEWRLGNPICGCGLVAENRDPRVWIRHLGGYHYWRKSRTLRYWHEWQAERWAIGWVRKIVGPVVEVPK